MKTNFDFLLKEPQFEPFAEAAISLNVFCIFRLRCALRRAAQR